VWHQPKLCGNYFSHSFFDSVRMFVSVKVKRLLNKWKMLFFDENIIPITSIIFIMLSRNNLREPKSFAVVAPKVFLVKCSKCKFFLISAHHHVLDDSA
jgi:hypothetical protein